MGQLEVEIHEANTVHVYPTCVSWIQIFNAGLVNTLPSKEEMHCRTWLRIYNSRVDTVAHGVKDLTIVDAQVNTINLVDQRDFMAINSTIKSIEALDWEGYRGTILNTSIQRVSHVVAKDSWHMVESHLGYVTTDGMRFDAREMSVINSTISHMAPYAFTIVSGAVSLINVTIDFLETIAIVMTSPSGFLALTNVTIVTAMTPCIVLPDKERISISNVTIGGVPLNITSPYLKYRDEEIISKDSNIKVASERKGCSTNDTTMTCDFANVNETIEVQGENIQGYSVVDIRNARRLQVMSTSCGVKLHLNRVTATLPHVTPVTSESHCSLALRVWQSQLDVVSVKHIKTMNVSHSSINRLHGGQLENLVLINTTVEKLDGLTLTGLGGFWLNTEVGSMFNLTIRAAFVANDLHIRNKVEEGWLTVDHVNKTSMITLIRVSRLERKSVVVRKGSTLVITDILCTSAAKEAIYVEVGGMLKIVRPGFLLPSFGVISVATRDQVMARHSEGVLIHVRRPTPTVDDLSNLTVTTMHRSPYCRSLPLFLQICDFSQAPEGVVSVDLADGQLSHRAIIREAESVLLYPSCIEKLILMEVTNATTVENGRDCQTWLEATGVHFTNITYGVNDVTLISCTIDLLAPDRILRDVDVESSKVAKVSGVHWAGYTGVFNNSYFGQVEGLQADSRMIMSNSSVDTFLEGGLTIMAEGIISNTTIKEVKAGGINVKGLSHMQDVTIGTLAKGAIVVTEGLLMLSNVKIEAADEASIVADINGGVSFQNVTVSGKQVHWRGYLAEPRTPLNHSLIFLNKPYSESSENVTPQPTTAPEKSTTVMSKPNKTSPKASSMVQTQTTISAEGVISSISPDMSVASTTSSWKWAGAGIGFFLGLIAGCCIFVTVKVIKPNKGRLSMPTVFWRVKDDHHELLQEEQPTEDLPTVRREEEYQPVPGSDIL
ncbi:uncharacterized protein LOC121857743 isoform X2 [Homarus americanus]|nr:uncharacterized protein LOC121857743 isoform X2 [Homarus americanus]